jgi:hypothetical protein
LPFEEKVLKSKESLLSECEPLLFLEFIKLLPEVIE